MKTFFMLLSVLVAQPLVNNEAVLEPSVLNEVEHAISRAPGECSALVEKSDCRLPFATNGLGKTRLAIALVSAQRSDGRWVSGTNDFTAAALRILKELSR